MIARMVRAYTPWPGVRCSFRGRTLQITRAYPAPPSERNKHQADARTAKPGTVLAVDTDFGILIQTTDGLLAVQRLKPEARGEMDVRSFVNGNPEIIGTVLEHVEL
jgi:methionyl-tRNA formyltransferase